MGNESHEHTGTIHATLGSVAVQVLDWSSVLLWILVGLIGWLQSRRVDAGWLTRYGGDVFGTAAFWWVVRRTIFSRHRLGAEFAAISLFVACFAWEFCQRFDFSGSVLGITQGVFDHWDLVSYALTLVFLYAIDKCLQRHKNADYQSDLESTDGHSSLE